MTVAERRALSVQTIVERTSDYFTHTRVLFKLEERKFIKKKDERKQKKGYILHRKWNL